jgi:hypothetical protein
MKGVLYHIGRLTEDEALGLDFADGLSRPLHERIEFGFCLMKLPVIDEEPYRIFSSTKEYRQWANRNLPSWLGYYSADD